LQNKTLEKSNVFCEKGENYQSSVEHVIEYKSNKKQQYTQTGIILVVTIYM